jgi:hypothetical protein
MSWLFSQALVEAYLGDISSDGEQFVPLNGRNIQQAYCAPDKMTKFSRLSRFGMMFKPLTENLGEELLTLYLEDFHAKISLPLGKEQELQEQEAQCGDTWHGLLARLDLDTFLWKIPQCSLLEDLEQSLETWPNWGTMRNGVCWEQMTWEQTTTENEFGYWLTPTATAISGRSPQAMEYRTKQRESQGHQTVQPGNLAEQVMYSGQIPCKDMKNPTYWPTPTCADVYTANLKSTQQKQGSMHSVTLPQAVKMWGTPKAQDSRHASWDRGKSNLGEQVAGIHNGGHLNPTWTEWLMGWPVGWTDLKPLEMDKFHYVQQLHGTSLKEE